MTYPVDRLMPAVQEALRGLEPRNNNDVTAIGCILMSICCKLLVATIGREGTAQMFYGEADKLAAEPGPD